MRSIVIWLYESCMYSTPFFSVHSYTSSKDWRSRSTSFTVCKSITVRKITSNQFHVDLYETHNQSGLKVELYSNKVRFVSRVKDYTDDRFELIDISPTSEAVEMCAIMNEELYENLEVL